MANSDLLMGIDVGTNATKVAIFTPGGKLIASAQGSYPTHRPRPLWVEQEPAGWWAALVAAMQELSARGEVDLSSIGAIGVVGQTNGHVLLDANGQLLGTAIIWQDRRAAEQAEWLQRTFPPAERGRYLGVVLPLDSTTIPARYLWLKQNCPEKLEQTATILQPKDYLNYKLTGAIATDMVSCKTIVNLVTGEYDPDYFEKAGLALDRFPVPVQPTTLIGRTRGDPESGLPPGIPVVAGTIDAWGAILGSGVTEPGQAAECAGTSEVLSVIGKNIVLTDRFNVIPSFDQVILNGPMQAGGGALDWFAEVIQPSGKQNRRQLYEAWFEAVESIPPGSLGLVFLPYLQGERAPIWDSHARGAFVGLSASHQQPHLARAVLEGVAFNVRHVVETIESIGNTTVERIHISGGGASSDMWNQIKADVTERPLVRPQELETSVLGAAMLAGIGIGLYRGFIDASKRAVQYDREYTPDISKQDVYRSVFEVYKSLYPSLQTAFSRLS
jgi:xylulokinase